MEHQGAGRSWFRYIEIASIIAFAVGMVALALAIIAGFKRYLGIWWLYPTGLVVMVVGYLGADFVSGVVHCLGDQLGSEETPFVGKHFIRPFRSHHVDQTEITRHDFVEVNGSNCLASLFGLVPGYLGVRHMESSVELLIGLLIFSFLCALFLTNQFHKWAHAVAPPKAIRTLQRWRLILSPEHHSRHHTAPFSTYYCITTGWLNEFLENVGFFPAMIRKIKYVSRFFIKEKNSSGTQQ
jgi:ubiquitin-conjugating enzyme E2 variant